METPMADYKIRIIARACMTRYDRGEGTIADIVASYNLSEVNSDLVLAYIYSQRPEIM